MNNTPTPPSATPARVWLPAVLPPLVLTLAFFVMARLVNDDKAQGFWFSSGCTTLAISCALAPLVCLVYQVRMHRRYVSEIVVDEINDLRYRQGRTECDNKVMSEVLEALSKSALYIPDHVPPEPWGR
jgi:hypothetical protein